MQLVQCDQTLHHLPWLYNLPTKPVWYSIQGSLTCPITTVSVFSDGMCMWVSKRWRQSSFPVKQSSYQQFKQCAQAWSLIIIMIAPATTSDELIQWHFVEKRATFQWPTFTQPQRLNRMHYVSTNSILWKTCPAYLVGKLQHASYKS